MKQDYFLRISDKTTEKYSEHTTNKILYKKWFKNLHYQDALYAAQKHINKDANIRNMLDAKIDIELFVQQKRNTVCWKMKWNEPVFSNGDGDFKGWDLFENGKELKASDNPKKKTTLATVIGSTIFFFMTFLLSRVSKDTDFQTFLGLVNFIGGVTLSLISPLLRANFNYFVKTRRDVFLYNLGLEASVWGAAALTINNFMDKKIVASSLDIWEIILISIMMIFFVKLIVNTEMDYQKLHKKLLEDVEERK